MLGAWKIFPDGVLVITEGRKIVAIEKELVAGRVSILGYFRDARGDAFSEILNLTGDEVIGSKVVPAGKELVIVYVCRERLAYVTSETITFYLKSYLASQDDIIAAMKTNEVTNPGLTIPRGLLVVDENRRLAIESIATNNSTNDSPQLFTILGYFRDKS